MGACRGFLWDLRGGCCPCALSSPKGEKGWACTCMHLRGGLLPFFFVLFQEGVMCVWLVGCCTETQDGSPWLEGAEVLLCSMPSATSGQCISNATRIGYQGL